MPPITLSHLEKRYGRNTWPMLLVLKEKHGEDYYLINDIEALLRAAVKIVEARSKEGWFYEPKPEKTIEEVPDDVIEKLPEAMKKKALSDKQQNKSSQNRYKRELDQWQTIQRAVTDKDGLAAFQVMDDRKDHEYEGWSLERVKVP